MIRPELLVVKGEPSPEPSPEAKAISNAVRKAVQSFIWSDSIVGTVVAFNPGTAVPPTEQTVATRFWDDLFRHGGTDADVSKLALLPCGVTDGDWLVWESIVQDSVARGIESLEEDPE